LALLAAPALITACAVAWEVLAVLRLVLRPPEPPQATTFEELRRRRLRAGSAAYRALEPLIDEVAAFYGPAESAPLEAVRRDLVASAWPLPWTAAEFLAVRQIEGIGAGLIAALFGLASTGGAVGALLVGIAGAVGYPRLMRRDLADRAEKRLERIRGRLPYSIDLMALMLEAGATFEESISVIVRDERGSPLADELSIVLAEVEMGKPRREALEGLRDRVPDPEIAEMVLSVVKGEALGTPIAEIFRNQAHQMLLKRSQWIEQAAAKAQVSMTFPGLIVMLACLLIIAAPFVIGALVRNPAGS
jgi:tight adherence protein C